jgi:hypothetical protein
LEGLTMLRTLVQQRAILRVTVGLAAAQSQIDASAVVAVERTK